LVGLSLSFSFSSNPNQISLLINRLIQFMISIDVYIILFLSKKSLIKYIRIHIAIIKNAQFCNKKKFKNLLSLYQTNKVKPSIYLWNEL